MPLCGHLGQQSKQAVDCFDHYSYLPLKFAAVNGLNESIYVYSA